MQRFYIINKCICLFRHREGGVLLEAALIFPIMLIAMAGILELSQYIQVKERINSIANQVAYAISNAPEYNPADVDKLMIVGRGMGRPFDPSIAVTLCSYDATDPDNLHVDVLYNQVSGVGKCGYGSGGAQTVSVLCEQPPNVPAGFAQQVKVTVGCRYHPMVNIFGFVADGLFTQRTVSVPIREGNLPVLP